MVATAQSFTTFVDNRCIRFQKLVATSHEQPRYTDFNKVKMIRTIETSRSRVAFSLDDTAELSCRTFHIIFDFGLSYTNYGNIPRWSQCTKSIHVQISHRFLEWKYRVPRIIIGAKQTFFFRSNS